MMNKLASFAVSLCLLVVALNILKYSSIIGIQITLTEYLIITIVFPLGIHVLIYVLDKKSKIIDFVGKTLEKIVIILTAYQFIEPNNTSLVTTGWIDFFRYLISFTATWFITPYLYKTIEYLLKNVLKVMIQSKKRHKTKSTTTSNESIEKVDNLPHPTRDEEWYYQ